MELVHGPETHAREIYVVELIVDDQYHCLDALGLQDHEVDVEERKVSRIWLGGVEKGGTRDSSVALSTSNFER